MKKSVLSPSPTHLYQVQPSSNFKLFEIGNNYFQGQVVGYARMKNMYVPKFSRYQDEDFDFCWSRFQIRAGADLTKQFPAKITPQVLNC
jgi:hypothetical protein